LGELLKSMLTNIQILDGLAIPRSLRVGFDQTKHKLVRLVWQQSVN